MLVPRASCERLLQDARVELADEWHASSEAVLLAIAQTVTVAVRRQVKELSAARDPSPAQYRAVAKLSRKLQALIVSLQDRKDPPPLLELDDRGRNAWEQWETNLQLNFEARGAPARTDKTFLHELVALRQVITGSETPGFTRGENAPLALFLAPAFNLARDAFLSLVEKPGDRQAHSLVAPGEEALVKQRDQRVDMEIAKQRVTERLEKYRAKTNRDAGKGK